MFVGDQKNRLIETVLLSTHNICFRREIRTFIFNYALLSKGLYEWKLNFNCDLLCLYIYICQDKRNF